MYGRIVGKGGERVKEIEDSSSCCVFVPTTDSQPLRICAEQEANVTYGILQCLRMMDEEVIISVQTTLSALNDVSFFAGLADSLDEVSVTPSGMVFLKGRVVFVRKAIFLYVIIADPYDVGDSVGYADVVYQADFTGRIIGHRGSTIQKIREESGAEVKLARLAEFDSPGKRIEERRNLVALLGSQAQVDKALSLIQDLLGAYVCVP